MCDGGKVSERTKLRIVSDGTTAGTYVETIEGQRITNVRWVEWNTDNNGWAGATITLDNVELDVLVDSDETIFIGGEPKTDAL